MADADPGLSFRPLRRAVPERRGSREAGATHSWAEFIAWAPLVSSVIVAVFGGLLKVFNIQERWLGYRSTCEALQRERHLFEMRAGVYATDPDPPRLLTEQAEALIAREHETWYSLVSKPPKVPLGH